MQGFFNIEHRYICLYYTIYNLRFEFGFSVSQKKCIFLGLRYSLNLETRMKRKRERERERERGRKEKKKEGKKEIKKETNKERNKQHEEKIKI